MGEYEYFFINYTRNEFCFFEHTVSIFVSLKIIFNKYYEWKNTDIISIDSQNSNTSNTFEKYISKGFKFV